MIALILVFTPCGLLLHSGLSHVVKHKVFEAELAEQNFWPVWATRPLAIVLPAVEITLGIAGLALTSAPSIRSYHAIVMILVGCLYLSFGILLSILIRRHANVPCGCSSNALPVSGWMRLRAAVLAGMGFLAVPTSSQFSRLHVEEGVTVVAATLVFMIVLWTLPSAMHQYFVEDHARQLGRRSLS